MSAILAGNVIALTIGVGLHLPATDAAAALDERPRLVDECQRLLDARLRLVIPPECRASGAADEAVVTSARAAPPVTVTVLAEQRDPELAGRISELAGLVEDQARRFGTTVTELVLRGDWSDEDQADEFAGLVLDVFVEAGEAGHRFAFSDALTDACGTISIGDAAANLSVMVHVR